MADPYSTLFPQLLGAGVSIAGAIPNKQDKLQRRIAMGGEDPALAAIRGQLARQNAHTAMSVAAAQQGVNPALASRNAQQALAQTQMQTNTELARLGVGSAQQARQSDPVGRKQAAIAQGAGQLLNVMGTGLAAQNAGMANGPDGTLGKVTQPLASSQPQAYDPNSAAAVNQWLAQSAAPMQTTQMGAPESAMGLAAPSAQTPVDPSLEVFNLGAPAAGAGVPSAQMVAGDGTGPYQGSMPQAPAIPPIQPTLPSTAPTTTYSDVVDQMSAPPVAPAGNMQPANPPTPQTPGLGVPSQGAAPPGADPRTWATPQERPIAPQTANPAAPAARPSETLGLPPQYLADPTNQAFLQNYDEAVASGDTIMQELLMGIFRSSGGL